MNRLSHQDKIYNGLVEWSLPLYFTKPVMNHLTSFIDGMHSIGFTGKLTQVHSFSHHKKHRTTLSHFLKSGVWNEKYLERILHHKVEEKVKTAVQRTGEPTFLLLDDTISKKTKPSSRAVSPIESCGFHFSHTEGKSVWGHQVVSMMLQHGKQAYPYTFKLYDKEKSKSKIELSVEMIQNAPVIGEKTYLLCDSWFTSKPLIEEAKKRNIHLIGSLKSNRIIYPNGIKQQVKEFAKHIRVEDTDLVTVGESTYRVYRYDGALNDLQYGAVIFAWNVDQAFEPKNIRYFLSTDPKLTQIEILEYYAKRWSIETFFQQIKGSLGAKGYQVRSEKAIQRYWTIIYFTYVFSMYLSQSNFINSLHEMRKKKLDSMIEFVYTRATAGEAIEKIKKQLYAA